MAADRIPPNNDDIKTEFNDITAMFQRINLCWTEHAASHETKYDIHSEMHEYQFHHHKCVKLYSLLLYQKNLIQCMSLSVYNSSVNIAQSNYA